MVWREQAAASSRGNKLLSAQLRLNLHLRLSVDQLLKFMLRYCRLGPRLSIARSIVDMILTRAIIASPYPTQDNFESEQRPLIPPLHPPSAELHCSRHRLLWSWAAGSVHPGHRQPSTQLRGAQPMAALAPVRGCKRFCVVLHLPALALRGST